MVELGPVGGVAAHYLAKDMLGRWSPGTMQLVGYSDSGCSLHPEASGNPFLCELYNRNPASMPNEGLALIGGTESKLLLGSLIVGETPNDSVVPLRSAYARSSSGESIPLEKAREALRDDRLFNHFDVGKDAQPIESFARELIIDRLTDWGAGEFTDPGGFPLQCPTRTAEGFVESTIAFDWNMPHESLTGLGVVVYVFDGTRQWRIASGADPASGVIEHYEPFEVRNSRDGFDPGDFTVTTTKPLPKLDLETPDPSTRIIDAVSVAFPLGPEAKYTDRVPTDPTEVGGFSLRTSTTRSARVPSPRIRRVSETASSGRGAGRSLGRAVCSWPRSPARPRSPRMSTQAAAWEEIAPMPEPRWFHASGVDAKGRVYAFGGDIVRDGLQATGGKHYGLVYLDPARGEWARAPAQPGFRRTSRYFVPSGGVNRKARFKKGKGFPPRIELPNGGCDGRRVYWFSFLGPIFFDGETGKWGQAPAALFDQEEFRHEGAVPLYRRLGGATAADPDGRLWLLGGLGQPLGPEPPTLHRNREQLKNRVLMSLEVYDPAANTYTERAPMHQPRWLFAASFGRTASSTPSEVSEPRTSSRTTTAIPTMHASTPSGSVSGARRCARSRRTTRRPTPGAARPAARAAPEHGGGAGSGRKIYVIGGLPSYADLTAQRSVFGVRPRAGLLGSEGPPLRTPRQGHTAVATAEGRIYAIGTNIRTKFHPVILIGGDPGEEGGPLASVEVLETQAEAAQ